VVRDLHVILVKKLTRISQHPKTYCSIKMEDKCKQRSRWDAQQVERAQIYACTNLLLAAACKHACDNEVNTCIYHPQIMGYYSSNI
jgi:hypothetical protein